MVIQQTHIQRGVPISSNTFCHRLDFMGTYYSEIVSFPTTASVRMVLHSKNKYNKTFYYNENQEKHCAF